MNDTTLLAIVTAIISGGLGGIATLLAYAHGYLRLDRLEIKRRRLAVAYDVLAHRYVLQANKSVDDNSRYHFNSSFNQVPIVFGDDEPVIRAYDTFLQNKNDENLKILLSALASRTRIKRHILDTHLMKTLFV